MRVRLCIRPNAFGNALGSSLAEQMRPEPVLGKTFSEDVAARKHLSDPLRLSAFSRSENISLFVSSRTAISAAAVGYFDGTEFDQDQYLIGDPHNPDSAFSPGSAGKESQVAQRSRQLAQVGKCATLKECSEMGVQLRAEALGYYLMSDSLKKQGDAAGAAEFFSKGTATFEAAKVAAERAREFAAPYFDKSMPFSDAGDRGYVELDRSAGQYRDGVTGAAVARIPAAAADPWSSGLIESDRGTQDYRARQTYENERLLNILALPGGLAARGGTLLGGIDDIWGATRAANTLYREVEIASAGGKSLGEFDVVMQGLFIEDKSARGLAIINPRTGLPQQTVAQWAEKQIFDKTVVRLTNLDEFAASTRPTSGGSQVVPSLEEIRGYRNLVFKIESASPELKPAVDFQLHNLRAKYPLWRFGAEYGGN